PIIAVYGVNDMAPWGHMYVNPGLTEPKRKYSQRLSISIELLKSSRKIKSKDAPLVKSERFK
ncbi:hypothetical protein, partial [Collinsella aerofaciens]|uniref:hypothetical protein n=1 Tax=Collinsella aerofaciens TaxID=74426 RepID=UPI003D7B1923